MSYKQFIKDRDEALLSLDRKQIEAYNRKYGIPMPTNDKSFWGGIHKARLAITYFPEEAKEISRRWLKENGFREGIFE